MCKIIKYYWPFRSDTWHPLQNFHTSVNNITFLYYYHNNNKQTLWHIYIASQGIQRTSKGEQCKRASHVIELTFLHLIYNVLVTCLYKMQHAMGELSILCTILLYYMFYKIRDQFLIFFICLTFKLL